MATNVLLNGLTYSIPAFGDTGYAQGTGNLSSYLIALASAVSINNIATFTSSGTVSPTAPGVNTIIINVNATTTINGPSGGVSCQKITFRLVQDGTGHTVTFASGAGNFEFGTDITSFTASAANKIDYVGVIWNVARNRWDVVSVIQGF